MRMGFKKEPDVEPENGPTEMSLFSRDAVKADPLLLLVEHRQI